VSERLEGVALIAAVAEKVMGWRDVRKSDSNAHPAFNYSPVFNVVIVTRNEGKYVEDHAEWNPLASYDNCFEVVEAMRKNGWGYMMGDDIYGMTSVDFGRQLDEEYDFWATAKSAKELNPREAICRAALEAVISWEAK